MNRNVRHVVACGLALFVLAASALAGCSNRDELRATPTNAKDVPPASYVVAVSQRNPRNELELKLVDRAKFDAEIARLSGNVVLVDCWATWCAPCIKQLPHTLDLGRKREAAGLAIITLNFDDADSAEEVRKALAAAGAETANATHLQSEFGASSQSMEAFEIASGALPHYKLYDRTGRLRRTFELDAAAARQFSTEDIESAVSEMLAEKSASR